ncbi:MAG: sbcc: exonuclease SbcC [Firmicutes bacterium]|nr:sbcc: exonuclease SbcC [Bacillota bacterium]
MKPITLKIAGLHSFREEQEIAFEQLSELGVFGIFGPTGSGKSSILDAMTLALYGTVVRAGRRTQGILNHAEKQVKVAFSFALGQGGERHYYRVERRYVRKDQLAVTNSYSRLVETTAEQEIVIADKDREVTEQITELLGLREEDFTRAVVLPQGKFAEFLNLGGKERREMLQRLFSLEQYGNVLLNKVNEQHRTVEISYIEIESEQKGLGDASPDAVIAAQAALVAAKQEEAVVFTQFKAAEQVYKEAAEVFSLQKELAAKQLEQASHQEQEREMTALAAILSMAEKAARAVGLVEDFFVSQKTEQTAEQDKRHAVEKVVQLTNDSKLLGEAYTIAQQTRGKNEPELIERRTKLMAAAVLEEELSQLAQEAAALTKQQQAAQQAAQHVSQAMSQKTTASQRLAEDIGKLEQQLITATVSVEQRNQLQTLLAIAQTVKQNSVALEKIKTAGITRKQQYEIAKIAAGKSDEKLRQDELRLSEREAAETKAVEEQLALAGAKLDQLLSSERQFAAIRLAGELAVGSPCPVCGSVEHPHPANAGQQTGTIHEQVNFEQEIIAVREQIAKLTQELSEAGKKIAGERQALNEQRAAAATLTQAAVSAQTELDKTRAEYEEAQLAVTAECKQLAAALQVYGITGAGKNVTETLVQTETLQATVHKQDQLAENLAKKLQQYRQEQIAYQEEINDLQQQVQRGQAELSALTARLHSQEEVVTAKQQELVVLTGNVPVSQLLARNAQSLETVRREEHQAKATYEQVTEALAEAEQTRIGLETRWQEAVRQRENLEVRLAAKLKEEGFVAVEAVTGALLPAVRQEEYRVRLKVYAENGQRLAAQCEQLADKLRGRSIMESEWQARSQEIVKLESDKNAAAERRVESDKDCRDLTEKYQRWSQLEERRLALKDRRDCLLALKTLLRGNVFVEFLAQEQMELVAWQASERLKAITQERYALEMSSDGGFLIRDDANGGVKRPVATLSGGETFQASLALALALSAQIQLKGKYPLEFFFLDEGFGSLDQQALDVAMATLEKLHVANLTIGIISHVAELKQRMPRRLLVEPAEPAGRGSRVQIEEA